MEVTHILQPFVRGREDILTLRSALAEYGLDRVQIMAKIENQRGLEKLDEIMEEADILCIRPGRSGQSDAPMGAPVSSETDRSPVPGGGEAVLCGDPAAVVHGGAGGAHPAEVCDIYNAVLDGSCALMLTGETAAGRHPVEAMEYLAKTAGCALRDLKNAERNS